MTVSTLEVRADALLVTWADGTRATYPALWLRDNCPSAFHPQTHERVLDLLVLDLSPVLLSADHTGETVTLRYADGHTSLMPTALLSAHRPGKPAADPADIARRGIMFSKYRQGVRTSSERNNDASGAISTVVE